MPTEIIFKSHLGTLLVGDDLCLGASGRLARQVRNMLEDSEHEDVPAKSDAGDERTKKPKLLQMGEARAAGQQFHPSCLALTH